MQQASCEQVGLVLAEELSAQVDLGHACTQVHSVDSASYLALIADRAQQIAGMHQHAHMLQGRTEGILGPDSTLQAAP